VTENPQQAGGDDDAAPISKAATEPRRGRKVRVHATNYDGTDHWRHPARFVEAKNGLVVTATEAGLEVQTEGGVFVSPFNTRGHYWKDRWYNVIRLEQPGIGLIGFYCNIATPLDFDGETLRYVDLQLDVRVFVEEGSWRHEVWDEDEFEAARERYSYDDNLVARCRRAVDEVIALVEARDFPFS
jgi:protein associated with RNAse G/E